VTPPNECGIDMPAPSAPPNPQPGRCLRFDQRPLWACPPSILKDPAMTAKMQAARVEQFGQPLVLKELDVLTPACVLETFTAFYAGP
jgi:hypothetical protein